MFSLGPEARLRGWQLHEIGCTRTLRLAVLRGPGLKRLGATRAELIETPSSEYLHTAAWAEAVLESTPGLDGLVWTSRQDDRATAYLFVDTGDGSSTFVPLGGPIPLDAGAGRLIVDRVASDAGILVTRTTP